MTKSLAPTRFAHDPIAGDSAQFPLARPLDAVPATDTPSPLDVRAWNLRGLRATTATARRALPEWHYDHDRQIAVDATGRPLVTMGEPSADSVSDGDGDEGRSEDWVYDFAPDDPGTAA
jgi:putative ATP-grasp target RiPP